MSSISCCRNRAPFTSWTAVTRTSPVSLYSISVPPSSSFAASPIYNAAGYIHAQWTNKPVSNTIKAVVLAGFYAAKDYPDKLRRIKYYDAKTDKTVGVFLTNNFSLPALTIAELYRCRWQVELFFKWIKQHLRIKSFFGTSENAVKTQIWIAISVYVLMAIIKKRLDLRTDLYTILQILSLTLFEKTPLDQILTNHDYKADGGDMCNQLNLFDNLTGQ